MIERSIVRSVRVYDRKTKQHVAIDVDVEIDTQMLARILADKAFNNKARKSRALSGLVEVRMRGTKITPLQAAS